MGAQALLHGRFVAQKHLGQFNTEQRLGRAAGPHNRLVGIAASKLARGRIEQAALLEGGEGHRQGPIQLGQVLRSGELIAEAAEAGLAIFGGGRRAAFGRFALELPPDFQQLRLCFIQVFGGG